MGKTLLMCDSTCDLTQAQEKQYSLRIVSCAVEIDGVTYKERLETDSSAVFAYVRRAGTLPHHSQVTVIEFLDEYARAAQDGYTDIICVTMNSKGSGTHSSAVHAAMLLPREYPEYAQVTVRVIDSTTYSCAIGSALVHAAERIAAGDSARDVGDWLEDYYAHQITLVGLFGLDYARKSGRLNACAAFAGELLGLKPIMAITGDNRVLEKVRGEKNLIARMAGLYASLAWDPKSCEYAIVHGENPEDAAALSAAIQNLGGRPPVYIGQVGPCVAINTGPRMLGLGFRKR
jgi:DegV family protein with EDD domain